MAKKTTANQVNPKSKNSAPEGLEKADASAAQGVGAQTQASQSQAPNIPVIPPAAAEVLGQITWLMLNSHQHRHLFMTDYEWLILPAVLRKQFRLIRQDEKPVAVVLWAYLGEEAEERMLQGTRKLAPHEWAVKDGQPWIFDVIAPFGGHDRAIEGVVNSVFAGREVKMLAVDPKTKGLVARTVTGQAPNENQAAE
jgi:cytolysin-activating lysine-acyltransferase